MSERDAARLNAHKSDCQQGRKFRNQVTKLNRCNKKVYYQSKLKEANKDGKKMWKILNNIMGRDPTAYYIETD